jgi:HEAT repeat-containing protein 5
LRQVQYYVDAWPVILHAIATSMESEDSNILRAMDGLESSGPTPSDDRQEPTALFFVLFGLAFEALVTSSAEDTSSVDGARQNTRIALKVLKYLVKPVYSGKSFIEGPIFEEFVSVSYRMAMSDPADTRRLLVEVLSNIIESRRQQLLSSEYVAHFLHPCQSV